MVKFDINKNVILLFIFFLVLVFIGFLLVGTFTCKDGSGYWILDIGDRETDSVVYYFLDVVNGFFIMVFAVLLGMGFKNVAESGKEWSWAAGLLGVTWLGGGIVGSRLCVKNESWFTHSGSGGMRGWI